MTPDDLAALQERRWSDPAGQLADPTALQRGLTALEGRGRSAYVVLVPPGTSLRAWRQAWDALHLDGRADLLLLYDGARWEARGWGLDDAAIALALDGSEGALRDGVTDGLLHALDALDLAAAPTGSAWPAVGLGAAGLAGGAALAGLGWILARRVRLRREQAEAVARARASLEDTVVQLVLDAERLGDAGRDVQDRAVRLRDEVRRLPAGEGAWMHVARIERLEDEAVALQSALLAPAGPSGGARRAVRAHDPSQVER